MKNLTILGCNLRSLELAGTLRREYPNMNVYMIDENDESSLKKELGDDLFNKIVYDHVENGVKFLFHDKIEKFDVNEEEE